MESVIAKHAIAGKEGGCAIAGIMMNNEQKEE
jgi:hypothetical protein